MVNIAKHIAEHGLSPNPIIVLANESKKWVVMDGNRRVTALILLNNPSEAPENYKKIFVDILKKFNKGMIPDKIECMTADKDTIAEYRKLEHTGPQDGIGQVPWGPREQEYLRADMTGKMRYALAMKITDYLSEKGVPEARRVSITNIQRLFQDAEISNRIGLHWDGKNLSFIANENEVFEVMKTIVQDFTTNGNTKKRVKDIFYHDRREKYLEELFNSRRIKEPSKIEKPIKTTQYPASSPEFKNKISNIPTKTKLPADRRRVIERGKGLPIPKEETKLNTILTELASKIDVQKITIGAGVLVRLVIELSVNHYIDSKNIPCSSDILNKRIIHVANDMKRNGVLDEKQFKIIEKMKENGFISAHTLNSWVHDPTYSPTNRDVCNFWDNIYSFLVKCWK